MFIPPPKPPPRNPPFANLVTPYKLFFKFYVWKASQFIELAVTAAGTAVVLDDPDYGRPVQYVGRGFLNSRLDGGAAMTLAL